MAAMTPTTTLQIIYRQFLSHNMCIELQDSVPPQNNPVDSLVRAMVDLPYDTLDLPPQPNKNHHQDGILGGRSKW